MNKENESTLNLDAETKLCTLRPCQEHNASSNCLLILRILHVMETERGGESAARFYYTILLVTVCASTSETTQAVRAKSVFVSC